MKRAVTFPVPQGTATATCRSCDAPIHWIITAANKRMPVDAAPFEAALPGSDTMHQSHFATCPNAAQHRKPAAPTGGASSDG